MPMRNLLPLLPDARIWSTIRLMRTQSRVAQALLVVVPPSMQCEPFSDCLLAHMLCQDHESPCGTCRSCVRILSDNHPDIYRIHPENSDGPIKIEQIRDLQTVAFQTPQLQDQQWIMIYPAEAMNQAAASALLKILEEPSASTRFILITTNLALLLPTIVSRCQQIHVREDSQDQDLLALGKRYPETSPRGVLYAQRAQLLSGIDAALSKKLSPCDLAERWSEHALSDALWFFSALMMQLIRLKVLPQKLVAQEYQSYLFFTHAWRPERLYYHLDTVYAMLQQVHNNINLNATLVWERIFLDFLEEYAAC
jgi:DNA polymerase-3 subunit delta'